jgi:transcriptional regulator with XRE-family HTH domain
LLKVAFYVLCFLTRNGTEYNSALAPVCYISAPAGERDVSIEVADKLAKYFGITLDELVHMSEQVPKEVTIVDKSVSERINLIQQLEEEDKQALFRIIDSMLTKTKFKDFFDKNVASL